MKASGTATVFGGTGFLGRRIVRRLVEDGWRVRVAARRPGAGRAPAGAEPVRADLRDEASVAAALAGADAAVNAVSLYVEKGEVRFSAIHEEGAARLASLAAGAGVARLVHISGIGADARSPSRYIRSRGLGERLVREAFPAATLVRPCVMFGPDDAFFNAFARILRTSPVFPLIGGGTRLQPVFVEDVAAAVGRALERGEAAAATYELGGPGIYTMRQLVSWLQDLLHLRRLVLPVPFPVAMMQAHLLERLPAPPLTVSQVELLREDNVVADDACGADALGLRPAAVEEIVPGYLRVEVSS